MHKTPKYTRTEKWCNSCKQWLAHSCFKANAAKKNGLSSYCKTCSATQSKNYNQKPISQAARRQYKYGLAPEEYERRYKEQNGLCAICKEAPIEHIDHSHETNEVRGLLCKFCNLGLGFFKDSVPALTSAIEYLS